MHPLSKQDLFTLMQSLARDNAIIITNHVRKRLTERNFTTTELKDILLNPKYLITVRHDEKGYTYKVKGGMIRFASVVVSINTYNIIVVTII